MQVFRCDSCHKEIRREELFIHNGTENGSSYRVELCQDCGVKFAIFKNDLDAKYQAAIKDWFRGNNVQN